MVIVNYRQKRFVMNMQLRQSFARAEPFLVEKKTEKARFCAFKKARISKSDFQKAKLPGLSMGHIYLSHSHPIAIYGPPFKLCAPHFIFGPPTYHEAVELLWTIADSQ